MTKIFSSVAAFYQQPPQLIVHFLKFNFQDGKGGHGKFELYQHHLVTSLIITRQSRHTIAVSLYSAVKNPYYSKSADDNK